MIRCYVTTSVLLNIIFIYFVYVEAFKIYHPFCRTEYFPSFLFTTLLIMLTDQNIHAFMTIQVI